MENDDTKNDQSKTSGEVTPASNTKSKQPKEPSKSSGAPKKTEEDKKKSYRRSWRSASPLKKLEIIAAAICAAAGIGYLGVTIWGTLQSKWNFTAEHRPRVIISRPPVLYGSVACQVTENAIHIQSGPMRLWVEEIGGKGNAVNAFVAGPEFKLVPEKKTGMPMIDEPPSITDQTCRMRVAPKMKEFPIYAGEEVSIDVTQEVGIESFIKAEKEEGVHIDKDAIFQLYAPICIYYFDQDGIPYGSCRTYRMSMGGNGIPGSGRHNFSCNETPVNGVFDESFGSFCDN